MTESEIYEIVKKELFFAGFGGLVADRAANKITRRLAELQAERDRPWLRRRWEEWKRWQR